MGRDKYFDWRSTGWLMPSVVSLALGQAGQFVHSLATPDPLAVAEAPALRAAVGAGAKAAAKIAPPRTPATTDAAVVATSLMPPDPPAALGSVTSTVRVVTAV